jgi:hypothetical protein
MTLPSVAKEIRDDLGRPLGERAEGLGGAWLGRARQPAVLLKAVHALACELIVDGDTLTGKGRDPYGSFTIEGSREGDAIRFRKIYDASNVVRYAGRLDGGELVGAWRFERVSDFAGTFWLARAESLPEPERKDLEAKAGSFFEGRFRLVLPMAVLAVALYASLTSLIPQLLAPVILAAYVGVMLWRKRQLTSQVARWEKSAAETSLIVDTPKQR